VVEWLTAAFKVVGAIPGISSFVSPILSRRRFRQVEIDLASLSFWNDGLRGPVQRIASGDGTQDDINKLTSRAGKPEQKVRLAIMRLQEARNTLVAPEFGMRIAHDLDNVLYLRWGSGGIRLFVFRLLTDGKPDQNKAKRVLDQINDFTEKLDKLHEEIRQGAKAVKAIPNKATKRVKSAK
jgi:hypothetical protein